ncbi:MAG: ABC transporter ATP-binding protein [Actinobacteria bacterium]|nr:ABC transporter ATP-binding protein [Actinomycetota bacterium]
MIEVSHVSKWFGDVVAVSDVSFSVGPGVTALLGPNGAGKSTLLRLLCGLTRPSQGSVQVLGADPRRDPALFRRLGLVPQQEALFEGISARAFVTLAAELQGMAEAGAAAASALHQVDLDPHDRRPLATYSKGMRQRVKVAQALVHHPELLVLDEPLDGLDPRQRLHLITLFRRLGEEGRGVLVSSHVLDEVERFGSRVLVMAQGRLAAEGDFHAIRELMDNRPHRLRVRTDRPHALGAALLASATVVGVWVAGPAEVVVDTLDVARFRLAVAPAACAAGARLLELVPLDDDLESVFRYLVGAGARSAR